MDQSATSDASGWLIVAGANPMMIGLTRGSLSLADLEGGRVLYLFNAGYRGGVVEKLQHPAEWQLHGVSLSVLQPLCAQLLPILGRAFMERRILHSIQGMPDNGVRWLAVDHLCMAHGLKPGAPVEDDRDWFAANLAVRAMEANSGIRVHDRGRREIYI